MKQTFNALSRDEIGIVNFDARIKKLNERFVVLIPGRHRDEVKRDSLIAMDRVVAFTDQISIKSFRMAGKPNGNITVLDSDSDEVTAEMKSTLAKLKKDDALWIENIFAKMPDGRVVKIPNIALTLVD